MNLIERIYATKEAIGISCELAQNSIALRTCLIKRQRNQLEIVENKTFSDYKDLRIYLGSRPGIPISIQLHGRAVLIKHVQHVNSITNASIQDLFPGLEESNFVSSSLKGTDLVWYAFTKKELIKEIVSEVAQAKNPVGKLYLGPFVADNILDQLNGYAGNYYFLGYQINRDPELKKWTALKTSTNEPRKTMLKLNGMDFPETHVLCYAASFSLLMEAYTEDYSVHYDHFDNAFAQYKQRRQLRVQAIASLFFIFIVVLVNTYLYFHYSNALETLQSQSQITINQQTDAEAINKKITNNDLLLRDLGWNAGIRKSWIMNQLTHSMSVDYFVKWSSVEISPRPQKSSVRFDIADSESNQFTIKVKGVCRSLEGLTQWSQHLQAMQWVQRTEIEQFSDGHNNDSELSEFSLTITYKYDI